MAKAAADTQPAHLQEGRVLPAAAAAAQQVEPISGGTHYRLQPPELLLGDK